MATAAAAAAAVAAIRPRMSSATAQVVSSSSLPLRSITIGSVSRNTRCTRSQNRIERSMLKPLLHPRLISSLSSPPVYSTILLPALCTAIPTTGIPKFQRHNLPGGSTIITNQNHRNKPTAMPANTRFSTRTFSSSAVHLKKGARIRLDSRIKLIRYHLGHPKNPRPLRFSRLRALRHWTIHRAWQLHKSKQRTAEERSLERQYNCMRQACEALRLTGEDGLSITEPGKVVPPAGVRDPKSVRVKVKAQAGSNGKQEEMMVDLDVLAAAQQQKEVGRLFRIAMMKDRGVLDTVPIEYARAQTDTPPRNGWDHNWTR